MAVVAGSLWVDGNYLYFTPTTTTEYRYLGTLVAARAGAIAGSIWLDNTANVIKYIDSTGNERSLPQGTLDTPTGIASAIVGSLWIDNSVSRIYTVANVSGTIKRVEHHSDISFSNSHTDQAHSDVAHSDAAHSDVAFSNTPFSNVSFANNHSDTAHTDQPEFVANV